MHHVVCGVVRVDVRGDKVDGNTLRMHVIEERRDPSGLCGGRPPDLQAWRDRLDSASGVVIELKVRGLLRISLPEVDVGLIPDLEPPGGDLVDAVARDQVRSEGANHRIPQRIVFGR